MSFRSIRPSPVLADYVASVSLREPEALQRLREETARLPNAGMQVDPEQGQFMALLARLTGAKRCLEIGTFTGYSALWVALALAPEGRLVTCDVDAKMPAIGQRQWQAAGVADKIEFRLGPALGSLDALLVAGAAGSFDFAFIDADKENYDAYYERVLRLLRPGGLALIDNVLWGGSVTDEKTRDRITVALRMLNQKIHDDDRVDPCLMMIGDGLTLVRKR